MSGPERFTGGVPDDDGSPRVTGLASDGEEPAAASADLLDEISELISALESHADANVGVQLHALLERMDAVHRTALVHLIEGIRGMAGDAFLNRLTADSAIRLLLMSYDLIAVDRRILAEEALDAVRGHLHAHGIDIELDDVVGGVVYVRTHGLERAGLSIESVRHDIEAALRHGLIGFQQLELNVRAPHQSGGLVTLGALRRASRPVLFTAANLSELPPGMLKGVVIEDVPILLANVNDSVHAVRNRCGDSPLPLEFGTLDGDVLVCPWHQCRYDVRTGRRVDGFEGKLRVYPVSLESDEIRVALAVQPVVEPADAGRAMGAKPGPRDRPR